jgi:O-antigen/teichoic acid export membrane protein
VFGPLGVIAGIALASITTYLIVVRLLRRRFAIKSFLPWWRPAAKYLAVVLPSTLCLAVLLSTDVLLVKHFFPTHAAGEYAAVAALGRAIFWGASGVAAVLFPKVVFTGAQGRSGANLVGASLVLVALGGVAGLAAVSVGSRWLLTAFAGQAYGEAAGYLPWYAIGMTMLGGVAVLIATHQSRGHPRFLAVLVPLTLLEPGILMAFHSTLLQTIQAVDISMSLLFIGLGALYLFDERARPVDSSLAGAGLVDPQHAVELAASR